MPAAGRLAHRIATCLVAALAAATASNAQDTSPGATVPLAERPYRLEAVGLSFYPPGDAHVSADRVGDRAAVQIFAQDRTWEMTIQTPKVAEQDIQNVDDVADVILEQLIASVSQVEVRDGQGGLRGEANVLRIPGLVVNDKPAARFYAALPSPGGSRIIRGFTIFQPLPDRYVTFEIRTREATFADVRPIYETVVASARFENTGEVAEKQALAREAAAAFIQRLNADTYADATATTADRFDRFYEPARTGADSDATELGYRRVRARAGQRGELNTRRDRARWSAADRAQGYIVSIDSRVISEEQIIDINSIFFMAEDRASEAWTINVAIKSRVDRRGEVVAAFTELGARDGQRLHVQVSQQGGAPSITQVNIDPATYLSQVEYFLLPQMLAAGGVPGSYAFTYWSSNTNAVATRRDTVEIETGVLTQITSVLVEGDPEQVTRLGADNRFRGTTLPNPVGDAPRIWGPSSVDRIRDLWRRKNLPLQ